MRRLPFLFLLPLLLGGCAIVGVDKKDPGARRHVLHSLAREHPALARATSLLAAPKVPQDSKVAGLLEVLERTRNARPGDPGRAAHSAAMAELVAIAARNHFQPIPVAGLKHPLVVRRSGKGILDPATASELVPAGDLRIKGFREHSATDGAGVPFVAWFAKGSPALASQPGIPLPGLCEPVTAVLTSRGDSPQLTFFRPLVREDAVIDGRRRPLAADYSAALAYTISKGRNRPIDVRAMLFSDRYIQDAGLVQIQPYNPDKIPVVFVHGLLSRPEAWAHATNALLGDPEIRKNYQLWYYRYPTGLPVLWSAAKLRDELDRFRAAVDPGKKNHRLDEIVLVGHSMGGLISGLMVRQGGQKLWSQFSDTPPSSLGVSADTRQELDRFLNFSPRNDVERVIFVATPHRGSHLALRPIARFFASLIRLPFSPVLQEHQYIFSSLRPEVRAAFSAPTNSIRLLKANSPQLLAIDRLPFKPGLPYHSIIGDRGRGDTPDSSDGVVPYWSSHLAGAVSETIVPSGHGANENPQGIAEMERILRESH